MTIYQFIDKAEAKTLVCGKFVRPVLMVDSKFSDGFRRTQTGSFSQISQVLQALFVFVENSEQASIDTNYVRVHRFWTIAVMFVSPNWEVPFQRRCGSCAFQADYVWDFFLEKGKDAPRAAFVAF